MLFFSEVASGKLWALWTRYKGMISTEQIVIVRVNVFFLVLDDKYPETKAGNSWIPFSGLGKNLVCVFLNKCSFARGRDLN